MVRQVVIILSLSLSLSACSVGKFWGEEKEPAKIVTPKSSPACTSADKIFTGSDDESISAINCIDSQVRDAFEKIQGKTKNEISEKEIHTLIEKGVIDTGVSNANAKGKVTAIKKLLGVHGGAIRRDRMEKIVLWLKNNRAGSRDVYNKFLVSGNKTRTSYAQLQFSANLAASLLRELDWRMDRRELSKHLQALFLDDSEKSFAPEMIDVVFDSLGILCPGLASAQSWDSKILAGCAERLGNELSVGKEWIEFVVNQDSSDHDPQAIRDSMHRLVKVVDRWIDTEDLDGIHPETWINLAEKMNALPPKEFVGSLDILKHYEPNSSGSFIHPKMLKKVFHSVMYYHEYLFEGMGLYMDAFKSKECVNSSWARNWKECRIGITPEMRKKYKSFALIAKVKNENYAPSKALDGGLFKKLLFFHSVSREIIKAFDDKEHGVIVAKAFLTSDEVMRLLETTVTALDVMGRFFGNTVTRLQGGELPLQAEFSSFDHLDLRGMARLVVLVGSDILPVRTQKESNLIRGLVANIFNTFPRGSVTIDHVSLTTTLAMLDSFGDMRDAYMGVGSVFPTTSVYQMRYDKEKNATFIKYQDLVDHLPDLLQQEYPRTYESCMEFGFERSCGIFLAEILPKKGEDGSDWINANNLDLITLTASGMESLLDSCDRNRDQKLSWSLLDGRDELDCAFSRAADITHRLIEAKIIKMDTLGKGLVNFVLNIVNSTVLTRPFGKVALMEGSKRNILFAPLLMLKNSSATLGSIYALGAEIADADAVKRYEKEHANAQRNNRRSHSAASTARPLTDTSNSNLENSYQKQEVNNP